MLFAGGTGNPFFTTDTAAALRAAEMGCDALLKGTKVDGIYAADPEIVAGAERFERLSYLEVLSKDLKAMDASAISLARENDIPIVVFSIRKKGRACRRTGRERTLHHHIGPGLSRWPILILMTWNAG